MVSCLSTWAWSVSLRLASYHLPKILMGCSDTVGIGSSSMNNLLSGSLPLVTEMLIDLHGFYLHSGPLDVILRLSQPTSCACRIIQDVTLN